MGETFGEDYPNVQTVPYKTLLDGKQILADIYTPAYSGKASADTTPVVLFFHAGGLTAFSRKFINPSFVQACLSREWTLVSADYRLLPQTSAEDILQDMKDAYEFVVGGRLASLLNNSSGARGYVMARKSRRVIVSGASAGSYLAFLAARYYRELSPHPLAILSYYGIPSFKQSFFNTSHIIWGDEQQPREKFEALLNSPEVYTGYTPVKRSFDLRSLNEDLTANRDHVTNSDDGNLAESSAVRPDLYDFYVQENLYPEIFKNVEVKIEVGPDFPKCVLLHGNNDPDGPMELSEQFVTEVGQSVARLVVVDGVGHCFDNGYFLEDDVVEMRAVADAWRILDDVVDGKWR